uniref:Putative secreted peptide n=1 Tax=Rhipicephalus pulchellus TaxID=72859 RepID=L7MC96_RHIPC
MYPASFFFLLFLLCSADPKVTGSNPGRGGCIFEGGENTEARVPRFRRMLKNPRGSKFPEPSTTASLIIISWFRDNKPQILLLLFCYARRIPGTARGTLDEEPKLRAMISGVSRSST